MELAFRPMFGGIMGYAGGKPFVSLSDVGLALKLAPGDRETLLSAPGARPLQYEAEMPPSKTYVVVPDAMLEDLDGLRFWIIKSVAAAPAKHPSRRKR